MAKTRINQIKSAAILAFFLFFFTALQKNLFSNENLRFFNQFFQHFLNEKKGNYRLLKVSIHLFIFLLFFFSGHFAKTFIHARIQNIQLRHNRHFIYGRQIARPVYNHPSLFQRIQTVYMIFVHRSHLRSSI